MSVLDHFMQVQASVAKAAQTAGHAVTLVAVSKTYDADHIRPVLEVGQRVFGENRVQEAKLKWPELRQQFTDLELHLIGPLQSNKVADAVSLFDVIETIDRPKIAESVAREIQRQLKPMRLYVQVNTGREAQKAGVLPEDLESMLHLMCQTLSLTVEGLMCIPPVTEPATPHFAMLRHLASRHGLAKLSMGMSNDFTEAIAQGATHIRIGSAIFGTRDYSAP